MVSFEGGMDGGQEDGGTDGGVGTEIMQCCNLFNMNMHPIT